MKILLHGSTYLEKGIENENKISLNQYCFFVARIT
jgi:hypothetical protein